MPVEIKLHTSPVASDLRGLFNCISDLDCKYGIVLHGGTASYTIDTKVRALPASDVIFGMADIFDTI